MNPPKCDDLDYIHFLIASQRVFTCTEAARCQPDTQPAAAHDAFTRLLARQPSHTEALWQEAQQLIDKQKWMGHLQCALRAFLRLEAHGFGSGLSWYEATGRIVREAICAHLRFPLYIIQPTA